MSIRKRFFVWIAILIPPIAFYVLLARTLTAIPFLDDYHVVLAFLLRWKNESGIQHLIEIVTYQDNNYRLMFENAILGIQYSILGHTNLTALAIIGDLFVIPVFGVLFLIWRECGLPAEYTWLAFVPASWVLFQLQYAGALNNATGSLQLIPVVLFALLTCLLATRASRMWFVGALISLMFAIASNSNGLFLIPIGGIFYLQRREFKRFAAWTCSSAIASLIYFYGYNFAVEAGHTRSNNVILSLIQHLSPAYCLAFLGNIAAVRNPLPAVLFGIVLVSVFTFATYDRLFVRRPALYYSALFFVVTGIAVSGLRSSLGLTTAMNSPYRINSTVLSILCYLFLAEKFYGVNVRPRTLRVGIFLFGALVVAFNLASNRGGERLLSEKRQKLEAAMLRWQRHEPRPVFNSSSSNDLTAESEKKGYFEPIEPTLSDAVREGIYEIPDLPTRN